VARLVVIGLTRQFVPAAARALRASVRMCDFYEIRFSGGIAPSAEPVVSLGFFRPQP